jgi:hypothetical protein
MSGQSVYRGKRYWSVMRCSQNCDYGSPHVWDSEHCLYGPYKCEAWPEPVEYQPKHAAGEQG